MQFERINSPHSATMTKMLIKVAQVFSNGLKRSLKTRAMFGANVAMTSSTCDDLIVVDVYWLLGNI